MGDIVEATGKVKEGGGSSSIKCPMLNQTNYTVWVKRMRITLKVHEVWEAIETETASAKKNDLALALLFQSKPETLILQVGELDKAKQVWEAIKARYVGAERVKEARLQTLMNEFDRLKMKETESIDDFGGKLSELASKSSALGVIIEEAKLVKKFLSSLPRKKYIHIVASLEQVLDPNKRNFEDITGRLKAYEERILDEEDGEEDQTKLMYTNNDGQSGQTNQSNRSYSSDNSNYYQGDSSRGRGRGGGRHPYNNRGRGRGRYNGGHFVGHFVVCWPLCCTMSETSSQTTRDS
ncbi:uncharacterized protein LOC106359493 [Brassica napus]|uniref:uncharacterized protein LOC106359493 n=1 Tax=Brassica napus TaxID=3708 RepID=UPI0006AA7123|nr:uncharacterized protein LOC106359493 [Brassica napus]